MTEPERIGSWMQTYTGGQFWPLDPRPEDILVVDIAQALSMTCRYNGHVTAFYSVAEHSVILSNFVSPENALAALLHDAAEAYVGDMVRPLKQDMPQFKEAEDKILGMIFAKYGLDTERVDDKIVPFIPDEVHDADNRILLDEKNQLLARGSYQWHQELNGTKRLGVDVHCWSPRVAKEEFMYRFDQLWGSRA